ncbi:MAG: hypothetical protein ACJ780_21500 [Solirubrobacteraceae bacterium]
MVQRCESPLNFSLKPAVLGPGKLRTEQVVTPRELCADGGQRRTRFDSVIRSVVGFMIVYRQRNWALAERPRKEEGT